MSSTVVKADILIPTLLHEQGPTGVQAHFNEFKKYLKQCDYSVHVITPFHTKNILVYFLFSIRYIFDRLHGGASVWWYNYWHYVFLKQALRRALRGGRPAVVYAQCPLSAKAALEVRNAAMQRVVLVVHFNQSQAEEWAEKGKIAQDDAVFRGIQRLEQAVLPQVDGIVYVSRYMQKCLQERIPGLEHVPSEVIPNFVNPVAGSSEDVRGDLINIGTLEPRKNQRYLLDVLAHANRAGRRYTLTLVGDGPDRANLARMVRELNLDHQVRFLGNQKNAARFIRNHRVYAHSAKMESFGIVLIEALAAGKPVIAAAVGGIPEVYRPGVEGVCWPLHDPAEGARLLIDLLEQPERLAGMGHAARQRYLEAFTPDIAAARLHAFLCADNSNNERMAV